MPLWDKTGWIPVPQRIAAVLWITFLTAGVATGAFFSAIDPLELKYCVSFPEVSRTAAYTIGFLLFLPFLVIDIVVSSILMSLGMMMLSPTLVSLPFKLLLFVIVDGWASTVSSMVESFVRG